MPVATYDRDPEISRYIEKVRQIPKLSREEEHELGLRALEGDREAIDGLVQANLRYVVAVALQYRRYGIRLSDLIAEGNVGLMMAVRKFDPERGTRFVTYAGYWIRAYILDCVVRSASLVGAGSGALRSKVFFRLRRERAKVANLELDPTERNRMLAERFEVSPEKMERMLRRLDGKDVSLDQKVFDDSGVTMVDTLVSDGIDQETEAMDSQRREVLSSRLSQAIETLDKRERFIVTERFLKGEDISLAAIGRKLGVSRERARQLEARAKKKLRQRLSDLSELAVA
jgi:RNA polymerase sigma-32 factor